MPPSKKSKLIPLDKEIIIKIEKIDLPQKIIVKEEKIENELITTIPNPQCAFNELLHIKHENEVDLSPLELSPDDDENSLIFHCNICSLTFSSAYKLKNHNHIHDQFKCKKCLKSFKLEKNFKNHQCSFKCMICSKEFIRRDNLTQHITYVHGKWNRNELFTCDYCNKGFKYKKSLNCHMKQHMKDKPFVCSICKEGFSVKNTYKQHLLTHGNKVPCKLCGKMLKPSALYYHTKQTHEKIQNFSCEICSLWFKTKRDLSSHMKCHDKKFKCDICDEKYSNSYKLQQHIKIHI